MNRYGLTLLLIGIGFAACFYGGWVSTSNHMEGIAFLIVGLLYIEIAVNHEALK